MTQHRNRKRAKKRHALTDLKLERMRNKLNEQISNIEIGKIGCSKTSLHHRIHLCEWISAEAPKFLNDIEKMAAARTLKQQQALKLKLSETL